MNARVYNTRFVVPLALLEQKLIIGMVFSKMKCNAKERQCIRQAIAYLASVEDIALLQSFGINIETSSTSSVSECDPEEGKE